MPIVKVELVKSIICRDLFTSGNYLSICKKVWAKERGVGYVNSNRALLSIPKEIWDCKGQQSSSPHQELRLYSTDCSNEGQLNSNSFAMISWTWTSTELHRGSEEGAGCLWAGCKSGHYCLSGGKKQAMLQPGLAVSPQNMISGTCQLELEAKSCLVDALLLADFCLPYLILPQISSPRGDFRYERSARADLTEGHYGFVPHQLF